ncbi:hypothetical protein FJT64_016586 [Amphibalanus amphitrite]|uniref:DUF985 domain-containing protein n=1 Tax=Amphibalanus amphitrite TaxID=1232801 RepID=A0A6A4X917_AMPAM|nr:hypothetical protein FJT64_016586 [Amphibalanus amphitrite]
MKFVVLLVALSLVSAEQKAATPLQISVALGHLYRRFLHAVSPRQLELQDALDMHYSDGMMAGPPHQASVQGTFEGQERPVYSYITSLANPGQKGVADDGPWVKQDACDIIIAYHYGGPMKVHMITSAGLHKEVIIGNPLHEKKAKVVAVVPKKAYFNVESLSEEKANFHSYISVPAWDQTASTHFTNQDMKTKFPQLGQMFDDLEKPGVHHEHGHAEHHGDSDHDEHAHHDGHGHRSHHRH